ncbi:MAG: DUF427 domain-containing protein [Xanthomonadales bacterium]|nr:DUF427 domain-containing protein [Xanthomonadales bacterium]
MWKWTGAERPSFANVPALGQESVWDYPRPPRLEADQRHVQVLIGDHVLANTHRAIRVLETASPPTFYLPPEDIDESLLRTQVGDSFCEWKGRARYWSVVAGEGRLLEAVGWSYPEPTPAFAPIAGWLSFYPGRLHCKVDGERVLPQPGGFYGGWLTREIAGPVKGLPGTGRW